MMEQKIRIAIIGLVVIVLICIVSIFQVNSSKQALERQIDRLTGENSNLAQQVEAFSAEKRQLDLKMSSLKDDLSKVAVEKEDLQQKYELLNRAREDLLEQIKGLKAKATQAVPQQSAFTMPTSEDAYWAQLIKQKTDLELQLSNVREELRNLQISNEQLQREKSSLELDITGLNRDKLDFKRQLEYNQKLMDSVTAELVRERNDKLQIDNSLKTIKNENVILKRQIKSLSNRKIILERKIVDLQGKNQDLEDKTERVDTIIKDKMLQIENIKNQIDQAQSNIKGEGKDGGSSVMLSPIVVRPAGETAKNVDLQNRVGKVSAVNRDNNFVVISFGSDAGLKVGDSLKVYRGNNAIANIEVIQVRSVISACDIKKESSEIQVGDTVK